MRTHASSFHLKVAVILVAVPLVSNAHILSSCHPIANTSQPEFAVSSAFDGTNFLVGIQGHTRGPKVAGAQLISPDGIRIGGFITTSRTMDGFFDAPRVAFGGGNYLIIWTDADSQHPATGNDVYACLISPAGKMVGTPFPVSQASGDQAARGVAFDGEHFVVVWTQSKSPLAKDGVVWAQYWTDSGVSLGPPIALDNSARSKLGLGLSGGAGRLWAIINTNLTQSSADVCGRLIARLTVALTRPGPTSIRISYTGVLQYSTHLTAWVDFSPQPPSPWITTTTENAMLFRSR